MIKLTFCLRRRQDLSREEFRRYWQDEHGPLVRERAPALGIRKYQQVHTLVEDELHRALQARNGGAPEPFDGIAEVWVDDVETFRGGTGTAESRQAARDLLEDEANFIDLANSPMWLGEEIVFYEQTDRGPDTGPQDPGT
ncbi:MAG: EthD domain-containing protein [Acidimicrobiales bacterium]